MMGIFLVSPGFKVTLPKFWATAGAAARVAAIVAERTAFQDAGIGDSRWRGFRSRHDGALLSALAIHNAVAKA
jgi:hypothetical protein